MDGLAYHFDVTIVRMHLEDAERNGYQWTEHTPMREIIRETVERYLAFHTELTWHDVSHIIHVTDLDGAFVDDEKIRMDERASKVRYDLHAIHSKNPGGIAKRNKEKRRGTRELLGMSHVTLDRWSVPYRLFYVSRNLEHAFLGNPDNLSDGEKERISAQLSTLFGAQPELYRKAVKRLWSMQGSPSWIDSWKRATTGDGSLQRGSNLYLVDEFIKTTKAERSN